MMTEEMRKAKQSLRKTNREIIARILQEMPEEKKEVLGKALERNLILTSTAVLSSCTLTVYKEGWLVKLDGTRCSFSVFAKDNDGDFEFIRKPNENKLSKLYEEWHSMDETDYRKIF
jgi:hypothetical protein